MRDGVPKGCFRMAVSCWTLTDSLTCHSQSLAAVEHGRPLWSKSVTFPVCWWQFHVCWWQAGRGSLLKHPSCPPDDLIGQGTELILPSSSKLLHWVLSNSAEEKDFVLKLFTCLFSHLNFFFFLSSVNLALGRSHKQQTLMAEILMRWTSDSASAAFCVSNMASSSRIFTFSASSSAVSSDRIWGKESQWESFCESVARSSSGHCQEMETCMVPACRAPWQPL